MEPQIRDWTHKGALLRWQRAAESVFPFHQGVPILQDFTCAIACLCGWVGSGSEWLKHLNESIQNAIQD